MAPLNSVTRAETDLSVSGNKELENLKIFILGRRCQKMLKCWAWGLNTGLPGKGNEDILALEPQIIEC